MKNTTYLKKSAQAFYLLVFGYCSYLLLLLTLPYVSGATDVGFLRIKQRFVSDTFWLTAFYVHVFSSLWVLPAGFSQFFDQFLKKAPHWHRRIGYMYVLTILCLAAPSGLVMAFYANGRLPAQISFGLLALLWFYFTFRALSAAKNKDWIGHQAFMYRSFALTCSAITLRIWKPCLSVCTDLNPLLIYQLVAWLGWVPNLIGVELWLRFKK
jgi:Predicted membrane protein (DUF2306)